MPTVIMKCTCEHVYQDKVHGKGQRVHNESPKHKVAVCTVCLNKKNIK